MHIPYNLYPGSLATHTMYYRVQPVGKHTRVCTIVCIQYAYNTNVVSTLPVRNDIDFKICIIVAIISSNDTNYDFYSTIQLSKIHYAYPGYAYRYAYGCTRGMRGTICTIVCIPLVLFPGLYPVQICLDMDNGDS